MRGSKALKDTFDNIRVEGFWFWLKDHTIWPIENFCSCYYERITRSIAFARIGWLNYDFDANTMWDLLAFKLKRIHPVLINGHAVQDEEDMNALLEAIAICDRLSAEQYDEKYHEAHNAKWGEIESKHDRPASFDKNGKATSFYWDMSRKNVNPENEEQERAEFRACWENGDKDLIADMDRLNEIFKKHSRTWWD